MSSEEIRKSFLDFFKDKGHAIVVSSSLIPDDPSVLLTTAGMQQFKRYYTGELDSVKDFGAKNAVSIQKCFRTSDIDEVGDKTHLTFFEMLGNFSFGGYFKQESILWAYEYLTKILGISEGRITVSVFAGDKEVPADKESFEIWHKEVGLAKEKINAMGRKDNFWGPTGSEGPCGPTTEIYVDGIEIWNLVFNEYYCELEEGGVDPVRGPRQERGRRLRRLTSNGVDTGMGLERLVSVMQGTDNVFETDLLHPVISKVYELSPGLDEKTARIFSDHLRAIVFLIGDGLRPGNKEAGYILRRLLRRLLAYQVKYDIHGEIFLEATKIVSKKYENIYAELKNMNEIIDIQKNESEKFKDVMKKGLARLPEIFEYLRHHGITPLKLQTLEPGQEMQTARPFIIGGIFFELYTTFGINPEITAIFLEDEGYIIDNVGLKNAIQQFDEKFKEHQEISRAGAEKKFGGHGLILNTGELKAGNEEELQKVIRLHTATHLLHQALRDVLGNEVKQAGSDITVERTRFDFTFSRKLTPEEIKKVEILVNQKIKEDLQVSFQEMPKTEAEKTGALHFFKLKYPEKVKVYFAALSGKGIDEAYSKEFCGGPHVSHTLEIGEFKIIKEEAVGAGVRRMRGIILP